MKMSIWRTSVAALSIMTASTLYGYSAPSGVGLKSINYAGSGCPNGTVAQNISDDGTSFSLLFDDLIAEVGPGISRRESRKNCHVILDLAYPRDWTYAVTGLSHRGYASLDPRVRAQLSTNLSFAGSNQSLSLRSNYYGPMDDDFFVTDKIGVASLLWAPCGANRALKIRTQIRLDNRRARHSQGFMLIPSLDYPLTDHTYSLVWRRCR